MLKLKKIKILSLIFDKYSFAIVFALYSFIKNFKFMLNIKYPTYIVILYSTMVFLYMLICKKSTLFTKYNIFLIVLFFTSIISSLINSTIFEYKSIRVIVSFFISFLIFAIDDGRTYDENIKGIYKFSFAVMLLFFIYSFISMINYVLLGFDGGRPKGMLNELTYFAQSCVAAIGCSIMSYFYTSKKIIKTFSIISIIFQSYVLLLTMQRGSIFGCFISLLMCAFILINNNYFFKKKVYSNFIVLILGIVIISIIFQVFGIMDFSIIVDKMNRGFTGREIIYKFGIENFIKNTNKLFGASRGGIEIEWQNYLLVKGQAYNDSLFPHIKSCIKEAAIHSSVLEQLFTHGIFGFFMLIVFYAMLVHKFFNMIFSKNKRFIPFLLASAFIIFATMFDSFFNRALFFDIVYIQNAAFCLFASALLNSCLSDINENENK